MMLQMVRLGPQYLNLAHVLGVTFGLHQWEDDAGAHEVALAVVDMATPAGSEGYGVPGPVSYRFYGATAATLRRWLDERTTVIAREAEACPEPVWMLETGQPLAEDDDGVWDEGDEEDAPVRSIIFDNTFGGTIDLPY